MKKTLLVILATLLLFTAACSGGGGGTDPSYTKTDVGLIPAGNPIDDTFHADTDTANHGTVSSESIIETENGFYMLAGSFLMFTDRETLTTIPVCAKPNCRHNQESDTAKRRDCNAYFEESGFCSNLFLYKGDIYVLYGTAISTASHPMALARITPDGSVREPVLTTSFNWPTETMIHRGRFYVIDQRNSEYDSSYELLSYSLDNPHEEPVSHYQQKFAPTTSALVEHLTAYGTRLYFKSFVEAESDFARLHIMDLTTQEWRTAQLPEDMELKGFVIANNTILANIAKPLWNTVEDVSEREEYIYRLALDGTSPENLGRCPTTRLYADDEYIYISDPMPYIPQDIPNRTELMFEFRANQGITVYDHEMNRIDRFDSSGYIDNTDLLSILDLYPLPSGTLILESMLRTGDHVFFHFDRAALGSGELTMQETFRYVWMEYGPNYQAPKETSSTTTTATTTAATAPVNKPDDAEDSIDLTVTASVPADLAPVTLDLIPEGYPTDGAYHAETDDPYLTRGTVLYLEENNCLYSIEGEYLLYTDMDTREPLPLCSREGCMHNEAKTAADKQQCEAYIPSGFLQSLYFHNGRIYLSYGTKSRDAFMLISMNPDGSDRREELHLEANGQSATSSEPYSYCLHRGQFYYIWNERDEAGYCTSTLWAYALDEPDAEPVLLYQAQNSILNNVPLTQLTLYANRLYMQEYVQTLAEKPYSSEEFSTTLVASYSVQLMLDLNTGEWTVLTPPEGMTAEGLKIADGKLLTHYVSLEVPEIALEQIKNPDGGLYTDFRLLYSQEITHQQAADELTPTVIDNAVWNYTFDGTYYYLTDGNSLSPRESVLHIYDRDFNSVGELALADVYGRNYSVNGKVVTADVVSGYCILSALNSEKVLLMVHEGLRSTSRTVYYTLEYADIAVGTIEPQELFQYTRGTFRAL